MKNLDPKNLIPFKSRNQISYLEEIIYLVKKHPNDMELGTLIRKFVNSIKG